MAHARAYIHACVYIRCYSTEQQAEHTRHQTAHQAALPTIIQFRLFKMITNNGFCFGFIMIGLIVNNIAIVSYVPPKLQNSQKTEKVNKIIIILIFLRYNI